ncbi:MAG: YdcF family protein [Pseudomonadota bacterium]
MIESVLPKTRNDKEHGKSKGFGRFSRPLRLFSLILAVAVIALIGSVIYFASEVDRLANTTELPEADGIVVLTGAGDRIFTGLELLRQGKGKRLLISGVHEKTSRNVLRRVNGARADLFDCCVDIDRALDTVGNAKQAGKWAQDNDFRKIILVTSDYHMPRSMIEFSRRLDGAEVIPFAVKSGDGQLLASPWTERKWQIVSGEFFKYIVARLRLGVREKQNRSALASTFSF